MSFNRATSTCDIERPFLIGLFRFFPLCLCNLRGLASISLIDIAFCFLLSSTQFSHCSFALHEALAIVDFSKLLPGLDLLAFDDRQINQDARFLRRHPALPQCKTQGNGSVAAGSSAEQERAWIPVRMDWPVPHVRRRSIGAANAFQRHQAAAQVNVPTRHRASNAR